MKKIFKPLLLIGLSTLCTATFASETYIHYQHTYGSSSHYHGDNLGLLHDFDGEAYIGANISVYNRNKNKILDDIVSNYYEIYGGYNFELTDTLTLTPNAEFRFYSGGGYTAKATENRPAFQVGDVSDPQRQGARYTPGLKLTWAAMDDLVLYTQYRYEYRKVVRSKRVDTVQGTVNNLSRHRFDLGAVYEVIEDLNLGYRISYYDANYIMQDNKKHDYQQEVTVDWQADYEWQINFAAEDVAKSVTSNSREAKLKLGFTYTF